MFVVLHSFRHNWPMNVMHSVWAGLAEVARGLPVARLCLVCDGKVHDERIINVTPRWAGLRKLMRAHARVMLNDYEQHFPEHVGKTYIYSPQQRALIPVWLLIYVVWRFPLLIVRRIFHHIFILCGFYPNVWGLYKTVAGDHLKLEPLAGHEANCVCADPFVAEVGGKIWLFYEYYPFTKPKGTIKVAEWGANGLGESRILLERPYHVSYPQVISLYGKTYLLPEMHAAGRLEFLPLHLGDDGWPVVDAPERTALEGLSCADATLWQDARTGLQWLFVSVSRTQDIIDHSVELHIFLLKDGCVEEMVPHRLNPVIKDCRYARCAGPIFKDTENRVIRPCQASQNGKYGDEVHLMEIESLTLDTYSERRVGGFDCRGFSGMNGLHHIYPLDSQNYIVDMRKAWERVR